MRDEQDNVVSMANWKSNNQPIEEPAQFIGEFLAVQLDDYRKQRERAQQMANQLGRSVIISLAGEEECIAPQADPELPDTQA